MSLYKKKRSPRRTVDWLTTYSDMVTLLMVFFIILLSFGDVKRVRTQIILSAFSGQLGLQSGGQSLQATEEFETLGQAIEALPSSRDDRSLDRSTNRATALLNPYVQSKYIRFTEEERGLVISLFTDVFFQSGEATLALGGVERDILGNIRLLLDSPRFRGKILIEGHTDNVPYLGEKYRDLYDLSAARAWAVLDAVRQIDSRFAFNAQRVSIHGYGATKPVESNQTPAGRAYNRRVDIILQYE